MASLRDALVGQVLTGSGRVTYHLQDCVGEGGQGWAFRARWNDPEGVTVLAKVLRPDTVSLEALRRFQQEAEVLRMLSMLPNPHVVRFYDHAVAQVSPNGGPVIAIPFTVLEFVNGPTLEQVLKSTGALAVRRARRVLRQVAQGLETVHQQKVVHRDLKPSNILLSTEAGIEIAKVTDFGLVKLAELNLVSTSALAGASLGYAPPEQYERGNARVSTRTDVFALGALAYEMLSGKAAFPFTQGENPLIIVTRILSGARPQLARLTTLPAELAQHRELLHDVDHVLAKALSADPTHRQESVRAFVAELDHALAPLQDLERAPRSLVSPFEATSPNSSPSGAYRSLLADSIEGGRPDEAQRASTPSLPSTSSASSASSAPSAARASSVASLSRPQRVAETVAARPDAWTFVTLVTPPRAMTLRHAALSNRGFVATLGAFGVVVWGGGRWTPVALPPEIDPRAARGVLWLEGGELLVFGEGSLALIVAPTGSTLTLHFAEPGMSFRGARRFPDGSTWLVGRVPRGETTVGVATRIVKGRVDAMVTCAEVAHLDDIARVGGEPIACGHRGALVKCLPELDRGTLVASLCHGNLRAIAALPDGSAVTVGDGGHALLVRTPFEGALETVQTTRDLLSLSIAPDASAWAGGAAGRIVRRTAGPGIPTTWVRMVAELPARGDVLAVLANESAVRAVTTDGALVEGRILA